MKFNFSAIEGHPKFDTLAAAWSKAAKAWDMRNRREWAVSQQQIDQFLADNPDHPVNIRSAYIARLDAAYAVVRQQGVTQWQSPDGKHTRFYLNGSAATGDEHYSAWFENESQTWGGSNDQIIDRLKAILAPLLAVRDSNA